MKFIKFLLVFISLIFFYSCTKEEKETLHPEVNADDLQKKLDRLLNL